MENRCQCVRDRSSILDTDSDLPYNRAHTPEVEYQNGDLSTLSKEGGPMRVVRKCGLVLTLAALALLVPRLAWAQGSITGTVKDTSGAVLPGVTVEASSPALIEKTRTVVTDGTGQYRIENLRPGTYSVSFVLAGFSTVRREGVELAGAFVASINAEIGVGALAETLTVTGETPIVDVQSTTRQKVLDHAVIDAIPAGRGPQH